MPQMEQCSASLDTNEDPQTYSDSEHYGETRSYSGSGSYDEAYSSSYSSNGSHDDQDQDYRDDDDDDYDRERQKNDKSVAEKAFNNNSNKLKVNTSSPSTPTPLLSSPFGDQVFSFMKDAFNKLVEGRDALGKLAGGSGPSIDNKASEHHKSTHPKEYFTKNDGTSASEQHKATYAREYFTNNDDTRELEEGSLDSNISYLESSSKSYSDDGLSLDGTTMTSERGESGTVPTPAPEIDDNNIQAADTNDSATNQFAPKDVDSENLQATVSDDNATEHFAPKDVDSEKLHTTVTDDSATIRFAVSATSSEFPSFDRYHCPSNPTGSLDSCTFSKDNIEVTDYDDICVDSAKEYNHHLLSEENRGMETIDEEGVEKPLTLEGEKAGQEVDSKLKKLGNNNNDKYGILNETVSQSEDVNEFENFPDERAHGTSHSHVVHCEVEPNRFNHVTTMIEGIKPETEAQIEGASDSGEEIMHRNGSNEMTVMTRKATNDEDQIQMVKSDAMDKSEMNMDQDKINRNNSAEILLLQNDEDDDEDSGKFTLSQESALVFSVSSSDSESCYRGYQAISGVIPIQNFDAEPFRVQIHTDEGLTLNNVAHVEESSPQQSEGEKLQTQQQEIMPEQGVTNDENDYTSDVDGKIEGKNQDSAILESILQEKEDGDDEELNYLNFQVPSSVFNGSVGNTNEELNDELKVECLSVSKNDLNESDLSSVKSHLNNTVVEEDVTTIGDMAFERSEEISKGNNSSEDYDDKTPVEQDRKFDQDENQGDTEQIVGMRSHEMVDTTIRSEEEDVEISVSPSFDRVPGNSEDVPDDELKGVDRDCMKHEGTEGNKSDARDILTEPLEIGHDVMTHVTELVAQGRKETDSLSVEEIQSVENEDSLKKVAEDTTKSDCLEKDCLVEDIGEQHNPEAKISETSESDDVHKDSTNHHEEVITITVEEKVKMMLSNIACSTDKRLVQRNSTVIFDEVERHQTMVSVSKNISPWWISNSNLKDLVRNDSKLTMSTRKAHWYSEQMNQSESLLQSRIVENGANIKKAGTDQKRTNTKVFWWPVPEGRGTKEDVAALNKNRQWFFDALEREIEAESTDRIASIEEPPQGAIQSRKNLSSMSRSWFVASDGKEKILEAMEDNQAPHATECNKENNGPELANDPSNIVGKISESRSIETAVTKLKNEIVATLGSLDNKQRSAMDVSFKNPVLTIVKRKSVDNQHILMKNTKQRVDFVPVYKSPTPQLLDLIEGIYSDSATRRSNASGTVKLMASQKKNVSMMASAEGLLDALLFAVKLECEGYDAEANAVTKNRALTTIALLAQSQENRRLICEHSNFIDVLIEILMGDDKDGRLHACSCFAALAKTEENRDILAEKEGLMSELANILLKLKEPPTSDKIEIGREADTTSASNRIASATRLNACAAILHLSKQCNISVSVCRSNSQSIV